MEYQPDLALVSVTAGLHKMPPSPPVLELSVVGASTIGMWLTGTESPVRV